MNLLFHKFRKLIISFYKSKKKFYSPKKGGVLIYDSFNAEMISEYIPATHIEVIYLDGDVVNVFCLIYAILDKSFWQGKFLKAYVRAYILLSKPMLVITFVDNDERFYSLSREFKNIKTMIIQYAWRGEHADIFERIEKKDHYKVDYMLVFGSAIGKKYGEYISGKVVPIGSFKNNIPKKVCEIKRGVVFISQYRKVRSNVFYTCFNGTEITRDMFYEPERLVLNFLAEWCALNGKELIIVAHSSDLDGMEREFYDECIGDFSFDFKSRESSLSSYSYIDQAEIVVFIDSTLGYESLARGNKTAAFTCRGKSIDSVSFNFGWPGVYPDNGPFWTNKIDTNEFNRVMDFLVNVDDKKWELCQKNYISEIMEYDQNNKKFQSILTEILI
jgi:surface carbohydrate biosynthesis protein